MKVHAMVLVLPTLLLGVQEITAQDRFEWSGRLRAGETVEVKGISGDIRAIPATGNQVEVVAVKRGRSSHFEDVLIQVEEMPDGIVVCALYGVRPGREYNCGEGRRRGDRDRNWGSDEIDVDVDFEIRVPAGIKFVGNVVSGDIDVEGLDSRVSVKAVSGDVNVVTSDLAEASTVSGSIDIVMGRSDWDGELSFETVSGDITLEFMGPLNTEVDFQSLAGDIESDFPLMLTSSRGGWLNERIRGTIGEGGRELHLRTISGDVQVRRGGRSR